MSAGQGWRSQAACAGADPRQFFLGIGIGVESIRPVAEQYCARCPEWVRSECDAEAEEHRDYGLRAGVLRTRNGETGKWAAIALLPGVEAIPYGRKTIERRAA